MNILLDLDGVLADFVSASIAAHEKDNTHDDVDNWSYYQTLWGMSDVEFWSKINGRDFWLSLQPYPWARDLLAELRSLGDVTILTSPSSDYECCSAKMEWLDTHLDVKIRDVMVGSKKHLLAANPKAVLVDDYIVNAQQFTKHGGLAILFPQPWNKQYDPPHDDWRDVVGCVRGLSIRSSLTT